MVPAGGLAALVVRHLELLVHGVPPTKTQCEELLLKLPRNFGKTTDTRGRVKYSMEDAAECLQKLGSALRAENGFKCVCMLTADRVTCHECDSYHDVFQDGEGMFTLCLEDGEEPTSVQKLLELHLGGEVVQCRCARLGCHGSTATKRLVVASRPDVMVLNIKRFHGLEDKMETVVHCEDQIRVTTMDGTQQTYWLTAVMCHIGQFCDTGHYIAFRRPDQSSPWSEFDDARVRVVGDLSKSAETTCYVLVYTASDSGFMGGIIGYDFCTEHRRFRTDAVKSSYENVIAVAEQAAHVDGVEPQLSRLVLRLNVAYIEDWQTQTTDVCELRASMACVENTLRNASRVHQCASSIVGLCAAYATPQPPPPIVPETDGGTETSSPVLFEMGDEDISSERDDGELPDKQSTGNYDEDEVADFTPSRSPGLHRPGHPVVPHQRPRRGKACRAALHAPPLPRHLPRRRFADPGRPHPLHRPLGPRAPRPGHATSATPHRRPPGGDRAHDSVSRNNHTTRFPRDRKPQPRA